MKISCAEFLRSSCSTNIIIIKTEEEEKIIKKIKNKKRIK
jgi:hypothetical protein